MPHYTDRYDAGQQLAAALASRGWRDGRPPEGPPAGKETADVGKVLVLGLPRGGVPVAEVVARELGAELDVIMVRKLGVPIHPELAMGAIGEQGVRLLDDSIVRHFAVSPDQLAEVERREQETLHRRAALFRAGRDRLDLAGKTVVIVDDGMATGATARVACRVARTLGAARVVLAVPVAARGTVDQMLAKGEVDEAVVLSTPRYFRAVGEHYADFSAVHDETVVEILRGYRERGSAPTVG
jgi:putative phosphoribosyl transferase